MSKFTITSLEKKTSKTNKEYLLVDLKDEDGKEALMVSIWDKMYDLKEGDKIEGDLITSGQYTNFRFPNQRKAQTKDQKIATVMEAKNKSIGAAMDRKEQGIAIAGAQRDATLWITTFYPQLPADEAKYKWLEIKQFFIDEFKKDL